MLSACTFILVIGCHKTYNLNHQFLRLSETPFSYEQTTIKFTEYNFYMYYYIVSGGSLSGYENTTGNGKIPGLGINN